MYGSGLRLSECTSLRIKDIDFDRREIMVCGGKGDKDRRVPMPQLASRALTIQVDRVRKQFSRDLRNGILGSALPGALERKQPSSDRDERCSTCSQHPAHTQSAKPASAGAIICMIL